MINSILSREKWLQGIGIMNIKQMPEHDFMTTQQHVSRKGKILKIIVTWPSRSSARTQPADHISIEVVYSVAPNMSSGAR